MHDDVPVMIEDEHGVKMQRQVLKCGHFLKPGDDSRNLPDRL
jgi:hypothetical protein